MWEIIKLSERVLLFFFSLLPSLLSNIYGQFRKDSVISLTMREHRRTAASIDLRKHLILPAAYPKRARQFPPLGSRQSARLPAARAKRNDHMPNCHRDDI